MIKFFSGALTIVFCVFGTGCGTKPLVIDITTEPASVAVSINDQFIDKSPVYYKLENPDDYESLRVVVEKQCFVTLAKRLTKDENSGKFPSKLHFVLQPVPQCSP